MTLELAQKHPGQIVNYVDRLDLITLLALSWLFILDYLNLAGPWLVRRQVGVLVAYDRGVKMVNAELGNLDFIAKVGGAFLVFSFLFVLIHFLEGAVLWLR